MPHLNKISSLFLFPLLILAGIFLLSACAPARAEASGPDAWRVANVGPNSSLNVRIGPGTSYPRIDSLAPDVRHLRYTECVPYINPGIWENFSPAQQNRFGDLKNQWCFVITEDFVKGWVNKFYLAEDSLPDDAASASSSSGDSSE